MKTNLDLAEFRALHVRARGGRLAPDETERYRTQLEAFARWMLAAHALSLPEGGNARHAFRVSHGLQVELHLEGGDHRTLTQDISCGGFSCLVYEPLGAVERVGFTLHLPRDMGTVEGSARVVASIRRSGKIRVSFCIVEIAERDLERLEMALIDVALGRLPG